MNPHHLCCTWAVDAEKQAAAGPEFNLLWERFLDGEDEYRNSRFKVSPAIAEGNWLIKRVCRMAVELARAVISMLRLFGRAGSVAVELARAVISMLRPVR
jgi:hypothetical protein